jgi:hypothetical protein
MHYAGLLIAARVARFAQLRRARPRSATGSLIFQVKTLFFRHPRKKTTLIFAFRQPFRGPDGVK